MYFCMVTDEPYLSDYQFTSILGFGKPDGTYTSLMESVVGAYWDQYEIKPVVTFDMYFNGTDSIVYFGTYENENQTLVLTTTSDVSST